MNIGETKRILIISANPRDTDRLRLDEEHRVIAEALRDSKIAGDYDIRLLPAVRSEDLQREIQEYAPHVLHFSGHGKSHALAFDAGADTSHWIGNDALVKLFELSASHLECVVFNACRTRVLAEATSAHVDYVVGMDSPIDDDAAVAFSRGFYTALFAGAFYPKAHTQGCLAVQMAGLPDHLTPKLKIRDKAIRRPFVPGFATDILILCADADKPWADVVRKHLDDLMVLEFGRNNYTLSLATDTTPDIYEPAALVPVFSRNFTVTELLETALDRFLASSDGGTRVFFLETAPLPRPDNLQKAYDYRFWRHGRDGALPENDTGFHDQLNTLARELSDRLRQMKSEIEHRRRIEAERKRRSQGPKPVLPKALLFVNAAPEDRDLLDRVSLFLKDCNAFFTKPLSSASPTPEDIRRDLENNFIACDLVMLLYGRAKAAWVREQILLAWKVWRKRNEELKIVVVHNEVTDFAKDDIGMEMGNVKIYDCPPDDIAKYLPECMGDACRE